MPPRQPLDFLDMSEARDFMKQYYIPRNWGIVQEYNARPALEGLEAEMEGEEWIVFTFTDGSVAHVHIETGDVRFPLKIFRHGR